MSLSLWPRCPSQRVEVREPAEARTGQEQPGAARSSNQGPEAARSSQEQEPDRDQGRAGASRGTGTGVPHHPYHHPCTTPTTPGTPPCTTRCCTAVRTTAGGLQGLCTGSGGRFLHVPAACPRAPNNMSCRPHVAGSGLPIRQSGTPVSRDAGPTLA